MAAHTNFCTESYILADHLILCSSGILTDLQSSLSDVLNLITNAENSALHKYVIKMAGVCLGPFRNCWECCSNSKSDSLNGLFLVELKSTKPF